MTDVENTRNRGSFTKFTAVDRFQIGRYAGENGNKKALVYFKNKFPGLKESTVRSFKKQHQEEQKNSNIPKTITWDSHQSKEKREAVTSWMA